MSQPQDQHHAPEWRISIIPWTQDHTASDEPYSQIISLTNTGGGLLIVIALLMLITGNAPPATLFIGIGGLLLRFGGQYFALWHTYRHWQRVPAQCLDQELKRIVESVAHRTGSGWGYRLLCKFDYEGQSYTVTPMLGHTMKFRSRNRLEQFLSENITADGACTLWINPENPLECVFPKRPGLG